MVAAHRNNALNKLDTQLKKLYPGIVIGWIADGNHSSTSDHSSDSDGTVDALDPMISQHFTKAEADSVIANIIRSRDKRVKYIIWYGRIMFSTGNRAWEWQTYTGTSDPHKGHAHISSMQQYEDDGKGWVIVPAEQKEWKQDSLNGLGLPTLTMGMDDADYKGWNVIGRMQAILGVKQDGSYGPKTRDALKAWGFGNGTKVGRSEWATLYGLTNV